MWTKQEFEQRLAASGLKGRCWGRFGQAAVDEIEQNLGVVLSRGLRDFGEKAGNLIVGPFSLLVCGNEDGTLSCVTETQNVRRSGGHRTSRLVKIMDHAGESYFAVSDAASILCYDSLNIAHGMETQAFGSFGQFLDWLFDEARAMA